VSAVSSPDRTAIERAVIDRSALQIDIDMQPEGVGQGSWLTSCFACLCCWSCWKEILWAMSGGAGQGYHRYEQPPTHEGQPVAAQGRQEHERSRLLHPPSKLALGQRCHRDLNEDPEKLMQQAGVPRFPNLSAKQSSDLSPSKKKGSLPDFGEACPTCLELYTPENPKITTKCGHHFHLACIYEWLERSQTCPMCYRPMNFEELE